VRLSGKADSAFAPIGQLDRLADLEVRHHWVLLGGERRIVSVVSRGLFVAGGRWEPRFAEVMVFVLAEGMRAAAPEASLLKINRT
jgi:hypothetical protein